MATRAYPHSEFIWHDQSQIQAIEDINISKPNILLAFVGPKGPEEILKTDYTDWHKYYGDNVSYQKYGQPLLQAASIVDAGGIVYSKRVVAEDATLANVCITATLTEGAEEQKTNAKGQLMFKNKADGNEVTEDQKDALIAAAEADGTTPPEFEPVKFKPAVIKYEAKNFENCKTMKQLQAEADKLKTEAVFPLFIIADIGRGKSAKSVTIVPEYTTSKTRGYMRYTLNTIENSKEIESISVCINHNIIENKVNRSLYTACQQDSYNLQAQVFYDYYDLFIQKLAEMSGNSDKYCNTHDLLYGVTVKQSPLDKIKVDSTSVNFGSVFGIELKGGSDGSFSEAPFGTPQCDEQLLKFYSGELDQSIYDLDNFKFDVLMDANYPQDVKRAIENLAAFRQDCIFMEDAGIEGLTTMEDILVSMDNVFKSPFVMLYPIYYDVIDPYSGKQVTVTATYSLSKLLIPQFANNIRYKPMCGELNGFTIDEAVENTENFVPRILPSPYGNQKEELAEARINHLGKYDGVLCFESVWTTQEEYTQLSYGNNVMAIQEVVKEIRDYCPANRFSMLYGSSLQTYKDDVNDILTKHKNKFISLSMEYTNDPNYEANKIYAAKLQFQCMNFNIAELFDIYVV